ncbi:MAG: hypothetical protein ACK5QC_14120 [Bacteroidota bacterium]|jgi:hypothetical protein
MAKKKETEIKEFVNPFTPNLTYIEWLKQVPSDVDMKEYLTSGGLSESEVNHILNELEIINKK